MYRDAGLVHQDRDRYMVRDIVTVTITDAVTDADTVMVTDRVYRDAGLVHHCGHLRGHRGVLVYRAYPVGYFHS